MYLQNLHCCHKRQQLFGEYQDDQSGWDGSLYLGITVFVIEETGHFLPWLPYI